MLGMKRVAAAVSLGITVDAAAVSRAWSNTAKRLFLWVCSRKIDPNIVMGESKPMSKGQQLGRRIKDVALRGSVHDCRENQKAMSRTVSVADVTASNESVKRCSGT